MQELDFLAFDKLNNRLVKVISFNFYTETLEVLEFGKLVTDSYFLYKDIDYILLPFTGKRDKNNNKIYLGDIVERVYEINGDRVYEINGEIVYKKEECKFLLESYGGFYTYSLDDFVDSYSCRVTYKRIKSKYE